MFCNICRVTLVLLLCGVICGGFCNILSENNRADGSTEDSGIDTRLSHVEEEVKSLKADLKFINDVLSGLLTVLKEEAPKDSKEAHDVKKRAVTSVNDGLSGLPDALLDKTGKTGGEVYTRWGRTTCGTESILLYKGYSGGPNYQQSGGGVNYQCMPMDPQYNRYKNFPGDWYGGYVSGVEFETFNYGIFPDSIFQQNAPCARCYTNNRPAVMMIPAKRDCSEGWTKEYEGYLMTTHHSFHRTTFECVDESPEFIVGQGANTDGCLFYFVRTQCDKGGQCPPYDGNKEMTCVVCSK